MQIKKLEKHNKEIIYKNLQLNQEKKKLKDANLQMKRKNDELNDEYKN